jgi:hypothetical protein
MPNASYNFSINEFPYKKVNVDRLTAELSSLPAKIVAIQPYKSNGILWLKVVFDASLNAAAQTALRNTIKAHADDSHHLPTQKAERFVFIDLKTRDIIARGFTFNGKQFSLTDNAQKTLIILDAQRTEPAMTYPVLYNTRDDLDLIEVTNADMVHALTLTALTTLRAALDSGTQQKTLIRNMTTVEDVLAYVDPR